MKVDLLKKKMQENGITIKGIAEKLNVSRHTVYNRLQKGYFKTNEVKELCSVLKLNDTEKMNIFFD